VFGLDERLAAFSDGTTLAIVLVVAVVLGLRHATDPDHLAAVTTLIASGKDRAARSAARLGAAWGLGHASSLFAFGLPIVLFKAYLPDTVQRAAETTVGVLIAGLAIWLLVRWRRGVFHVHVHVHTGPVHAHGHTHAARPAHPHAAPRVRSAWQAYAIGVVHGMGGSAGVGVLLLAAIHDRLVAVCALALFAAFTAISMALLSTGFGLTLQKVGVGRWFHRTAPILGSASLAFGVWYALDALSVTPYYF
jgi:high-affinity nickel permease